MASLLIEEGGFFLLHRFEVGSRKSEVGSGRRESRRRGPKPLWRAKSRTDEGGRDGKWARPRHVSAIRALNRLLLHCSTPPVSQPFLTGSLETVNHSTIQ